MKTLKITRPFKAALITAALSASLYPASSFAGSDSYVFKLVGHPTDTTVSVELVNTSTGQPVMNAELFTLRWTATGIKNMPRTQQRIPLTPNGDGTFTAEAEPGDTLQMAAQVPGDDELIRGSVDVSR